MLFLATSALEVVKQLTRDDWIKIGIAIGGLIVVVIVLRKIARMNKIVLGVVVLVSLSIFFFSWVYNRNEPKFMTPLIDKLAPFFPSANSYAAKQQTTTKP